MNHQLPPVYGQQQHQHGAAAATATTTVPQNHHTIINSYAPSELIIGNGTGNSSETIFDEEVPVHLKNQDREAVARTFVVNPAAPGYEGKLSMAATADRIRHSTGQRGANRVYLENTVEHLHRLGIADRRLSALLAAVKASA